MHKVLLFVLLLLPFVGLSQPAPIRRNQLTTNVPPQPIVGPLRVSGTPAITVANGGTGIGIAVTNAAIAVYPLLGGVIPLGRINWDGSASFGWNGAVNSVIFYQPGGGLGADFVGGLSSYNDLGVFTLAGLKIPTGAGVGKVLTSDGSGTGTWQTPGTNILTASANLDFPSTLGQTHSDLSIALTGVGTNDVVSIGVPINAMQLAGCVYMGYPSNNTVWVRFLNSGVVAKDPAPGVFKVLVTQ